MICRIDDYTLSHPHKRASNQTGIGQEKMNVPSVSEQLRYFKKQQPKIVKTIRQLVDIESPSDVKQAVDRLGTVLASRFAELGGRKIRQPFAGRFQGVWQKQDRETGAAAGAHGHGLSHRDHFEDAVPH